MQSQGFKAICIYFPTVALTLIFNISEGSACESRQFTCLTDERCIPISKFCDGSKDCADGSDEPYRTANISASSSTIACRRNTSMVTRRVCILPSQLYAHKEELCQGSTCKFLHEFPCADGSQCIPKSGFCNGVANCQDRSDEVYHYSSSFGGEISATMCRRNDRTCYITTPFIKDKELFCESDNCASTTFACQDGHGCIVDIQFCDGKADCRDGSDEPPYRYKNTSYDANTRICHGISWGYDKIAGRQQKVWGTRICLLPQYLEPFESEICQGSTCSEGEFSCLDGSQCVLYEKFCNGIADCDDGSDEILRYHSDVYSNNLTSCRGGWIFPDTVDVCMVSTEAAGIMPCKNSDCINGEFSCLDGSRCIEHEKFCDGKIDCRDGSDEPSLRNSNYNHPPGVTFCRKRVIDSRDVHLLCVLPPNLVTHQNDICNGSLCKGDEFACEDGSRCIAFRLFCDGNWDCRDGSDEPPLRQFNASYSQHDTPCRGKSGSFKVGRFVCRLPKRMTSQHDKLCDGSSCKNHEFSCSDGSQCISRRLLFCNGKPDCIDGSDEPPLRRFNSSHDRNATLCRGLMGSFICVLPPELVPQFHRLCADTLCTDDEFPCSDGSQCVPGESYCDGHLECLDGSDEPSLWNNAMRYGDDVIFCRNKKAASVCVLPPNHVRYKDKICAGSLCKVNEFACEDGSRCIAIGLFCNGNWDCRDGSDEPPLRQFNASYSHHDTPCRGTSWSFKVGRFVCMLPKRLTSQREKLCDGSSCKNQEFSCSDGSKCISRRLFCNGKPDCIDGSDEPPIRRYNSSHDRDATLCRAHMGSFICVLPPKFVPQFDRLCADTLCTDDEFPCSDGSQCVPGETYCDDNVDCLDGSDEPPLKNNAIRYGYDVTFCRSKKALSKFVRGHGRVTPICVLPPNHVRYRDKICAATPCRPDEFQCSDGSFCIEKKSFCNHEVGFPICRDKSDHILFNNSIKYNASVGFCRKTVYWGGRVCMLPEGEPASAFDCEGSSCHSNEFSCDYGSRCLRMELYCDGEKHCSDGTDELPWTNRDMDIAGTSCRRKRGNNGRHSICVLPSNLATHRGQLCGGFSCWVNEFPCANGRMCLPQSQYCNGEVECEDGSDEFKQPEKTNYSGRICHRRGNQCMIPDSHICDGFSFCDDDIDECLCPTSGNHRSDDKCFQCLVDTFMVLPISKYCDGVFDCMDLTDECLCSPAVWPEICENVLWDTGKPQLSSIECTVGRNATKTFIDASMVCDHQIDCPNGEDENNCQRKESPSSSSQQVKELNYECKSPVGKYATKCDGIVECDDFLMEECWDNCDPDPEYCQFIDIYSHYTGSFGSLFIPDDPTCDHIVTGEYFFLSRENMCDGESSCDNFADERGCKSRFYCTDEPLPNIPIEKKCDKHYDCDDGADEKDCSHFSSEVAGAV